MTEKPFGNLFINAGAMKAGTTWLHWALRMNPRLHFSLEKEIHYFHLKYVSDRVLTDGHRQQQVRNYYSVDLQNDKLTMDEMRAFVHALGVYLRSPMDDTWYSDLIRPPEGKDWSCDFSNLYSELPESAWADIAASCSKLRVLYMLRDPLHRLWSHLKFDLQYNGQLADLAHWSPAQCEDYLRQPHIWHNAEYGLVARRLTGALATDQVKFMFLPEVHTNALGFLREVEHFVGIPPAPYPPWILRDKVNKSDPLPMPDFFADLFRADVDRITRELSDCGITPPDDWT